MTHFLFHKILCIHHSFPRVFFFKLFFSKRKQKGLLRNFVIFFTQNPTPRIFAGYNEYDIFAYKSIFSIQKGRVAFFTELYIGVLFFIILFFITTERTARIRSLYITCV